MRVTVRTCRLISEFYKTRWFDVERKLSAWYWSCLSPFLGFFVGCCTATHGRLVGANDFWSSTLSHVTQREWLTEAELPHCFWLLLSLSHPTAPREIGTVHCVPRGRSRGLCPAQGLPLPPRIGTCHFHWEKHLLIQMLASCRPGSSVD